MPKTSQRSRTLLITCGILVVVAVLVIIFDSVRKSTMLDSLSSVYSQLAGKIATEPVELAAVPDDFLVPIVIDTSGGQSAGSPAVALGPAGVDGSDGANGLSGNDGINGVDGGNGIDGKDGADGIDGVNGADGADGQDGADGVATCFNGLCASLQLIPTVQETGVMFVDEVVATSLQDTTLEGNGSALTSLDANNITAGTLANARLSASVTLAGNGFNGASQLVQTTGAGTLPALSGENLTTLNASSITTGTLAMERLSSNVALLSRDSQVFTGDSIVFRADNNASSGFSMQNSSSTSILSVDTQNGPTTANSLKATGTGLTVGLSGTPLEQIVVYTPTLNPSNVPAASTVGVGYSGLRSAIRGL